MSTNIISADEFISELSIMHRELLEEMEKNTTDVDFARWTAGKAVQTAKIIELAKNKTFRY